MKNIDLGQTIGILANIGVVASIIFLGVELRDSGTLARAATTIDGVGHVVEWKNLIAGNTDVLDTYVRGMADFQELSPREQARFDLLMRSYLQMTLAVTLAREAGLIPTQPVLERRMYEGDMLRIVDEPGFKQWWSTADRRGLPPQIDALIEELQGSVAAE